MANILTIKEKILAFLQSMNIKKVEYFETAGIQSSNFKGKNMQSQAGGDMIVKTLTMFPQLSAEWLMRGEGSMLKDNASLAANSLFRQNLNNEKIKDSVLMRLREYLSARCVSVPALAAALGMGADELTSALADDGFMDIYTLYNIIRHFPDLSAEWLFRGGTMECASLRDIAGEVAALKRVLKDNNLG